MSHAAKTICQNFAKAMHTVYFTSLGEMPYDEAYRLQKHVFEHVSKAQMPDTVLSVEHPHVYTLGKQSNPAHLLWSKETLQAKNVAVFETDRGGEITYHGYGQFVAYPILNLNHFYKDAHRYLRDLEEVIIRLLGELGVAAGRKQHHDPRKNYTGVWIGEEKICAIGVKFSNWTTMHGLALNVNTDLSYFEGIVPCGIMDKGVTSLAKILSQDVPLTQIEELFIKHFGQVFGVSVERMEKWKLQEQIRQHHQTFSTSLEHKL